MNSIKAYLKWLIIITLKKTLVYNEISMVQIADTVIKFTSESVAIIVSSSSWRDSKFAETNGRHHFSYQCAFSSSLRWYYY